jgi:hypothetical protein
VISFVHDDCAVPNSASCFVPSVPLYCFFPRGQRTDSLLTNFGKASYGLERACKSNLNRTTHHESFSKSCSVKVVGAFLLILVLNFGVLAV